MPDPGTTLLTLDEVCTRLHITPRQMRRLRTGPDPLPVVPLMPRVLRVDPDALAAWLARRAVAGGVGNLYRPGHDRQTATAAAAPGRPDAEATRAASRDGDGVLCQRRTGRNGGRPRSGGPGRDARGGLPIS